MLQIAVVMLCAAIGLYGCGAGLFGTERSARPVRKAQTESFFIDVPEHGVAVTHSGKMMLAAGPPGIAPFREKAIRNGLAIIMKVRDEGGEVIGFASELEVFPADADMLHGDVVWDTAWTVVIPGRGTLFLHEQEHSGELGPKVIGPTLERKKPWVGDWSTTSTVGPGPDGRGVVAGGSGEFEGAAGWFVENIRLTKFTPKGVMFATVELEVHLEP